MMTSEDTSLGTLLQRSDLPDAAGMDAIEARVVVVQEVPPKAEIRFYAVRGDDHQRLTEQEAMKLLRFYFPQKPLTELSNVELIVEVLALRAEAARMKPVYEAAKVWREYRRPDAGTADAALVAAIDDATGKDDIR